MLTGDGHEEDRQEGRATQTCWSRSGQEYEKGRNYQSIKVALESTAKELELDEEIGLDERIDVAGCLRRVNVG